MKKTRRIGIQTLGIVRQLTGEGAPEGAAADCLNFRYRDGALRRIGDPTSTVTTDCPTAATNILFHPLLPDGEFLYRLGQTLYWHHHRDGWELLTLEVGEIFTSWIAFGTSVVVSTSKYTRVMVLKDGEWVVIPPIDDTSICVSNDTLNGINMANVTIYNNEGLIADGNNNRIATEIFLGKDDSGNVIEIFPFTSGNTSFSRPFSKLELKPTATSLGMISGFVFVIVCIKLSDGSTLFQSIPKYVQFGECKIKTDYDNNSSRYNYFDISDNADAYVHNMWQGDRYDGSGSTDRCRIVGGPFFCVPSMNISFSPDFIKYINALRSTNIINGIAIYSTRVKQLFDIEKSYKSYKDLESSSFISKSKDFSYLTYQYLYKWKPVLTKVDPNDIYFLLKEIPATELLSTTITVNLKPEDFDGLEFKDVLRANGTRHAIRATSYMMDFNSRLHGCGISTTFSGGDNVLAQPYGSTPQFLGWLPNAIDGVSLHEEVDISADGKTVTTVRPLSGTLYSKAITAGYKHALILPPVVAYPDARATRMRIIASYAGVGTPASSLSTLTILPDAYDILYSDRQLQLDQDAEPLYADGINANTAALSLRLSIRVNSTLFSSPNFYAETPMHGEVITSFHQTVLLEDISTQLASWIDSQSFGVTIATTSSSDTLSLTSSGGIALIETAIAGGYTTPSSVVYTVNTSTAVVGGQGGTVQLLELPLKQNLENNIAYALGDAATTVMQPPFIKEIPALVTDTSKPDFTSFTPWRSPSSVPAPVLYQPNRLQVWGYGSPLFYELKNSYRIGSQDESLLRVETTVDQLTEGRFGEYPIYCFTDRALYALQQGQGEVLYASCIPISADGILSSNGATPLAGAVAFTSPRGVLAVTGRQVVELSRPLLGDTEIPDSIFYNSDEDSLIDYLQGAELQRIYRMNELLVYNSDYSYGYVYSLDGKMWTRRNMLYTRMQRSKSRLMCYSVVNDVLRAADLELETKASTYAATWLSRPLELGTDGYKKVEGAVSRLSEINGADIVVSLYGSVDGVTYSLIQKAVANEFSDARRFVALGRSGVSCRSFMVQVAIGPTTQGALQRIDFELEDRFSAKLR